MAKRVTYEIGTPGANVLWVSSQKEMTRCLRSAAELELSRRYGFVVRKLTNGKVTDRYEVKVTVTLKRQRAAGS